ncbi:MAG: MBL fold metallo-hydrolase [Ahrensia sp.]|nr:MBL fold metallo-hydrolase [Ahrensia sp.]
MTSLSTTRRSLLTGTTAAVAAAPLAAPLLMSRAAHAASPAAGLANATHHTVDLGDFKVTTFLDASAIREGPHPIFGQDQPAEAVEQLMEENLLPPKQVRFYFTPILVQAGDRKILFDTGLGGNAGTVASQLETAGIGTDTIDTVVITHMHGDHIGGLMDGDEPVFANASYVTSEAEMNFWTSDTAMSGPTEGGAKAVATKVTPLREKFTLIRDGGEVGSGITAMAAFGHTPGHMVYHLESGGKRMLITADTANHFVASLAQPDWHVRFDMDKDAAAATRRKVFGMLAADRVPFSGYHMPFPAVGFVEEMGNGFRYIAETYQL